MWMTNPDEESGRFELSEWDTTAAWRPNAILPQ